MDKIMELLIRIQMLTEDMQEIAFSLNRPIKKYCDHKNIIFSGEEGICIDCGKTTKLQNA